MVPRRAPIFYIFLDKFLTIFWNTFGTILGPILGPDLPKRDQDEPKRAIRIFIEPKPVFIKKWFSRGTVGIFSLLRPPKRASRGPRRLPRGTRGAPKTPKKGIQDWTQKLTNVGPILGPKMGPKTAPKLDSFEVCFWIPSFEGSGALSGPLGSLLGPLEALLGGLWTPKTLKN